MNSTHEHKSDLVRAFERLTQRSAIPARDDTLVPLPASHFVTDHCFAKHIARTKESFAFVPDQDPWQTYGILRSANEAWQHDKLPVIAICAYSYSSKPFERETGIQTDTADQFLRDLKFAQNRVTKLGESPAYIIRHHLNPTDKYDEVILPSHANVIVYQPYALSSTQLAFLFHHVADVNGKIILCDNRYDFTVSHQKLSEAVDTSISNAVPPAFRKVLDLSPRQNEFDNECLPNSTILQKNAPSRGDLSHSDPLPHPALATPPNTYRIYHAKNPNDVTSPSNYDLVAEVEAENIYRALSKSQSFGAPWTDNPGVATRVPGRLRSTRPGDLVVHNGVAQRYDGDGFQPMDFPHPLPIERLKEPVPSVEPPEAATPALEAPRKKIKV